MSTYFKSPANDRRHPLFSFQGLEIYTARHEDFWLALLWNEMDPHHAGKIDPSFWIEQSPGIEAYLMADKKGRLFFFKLVRTILAIGQESKTISAVRVFIQFPPQPGAVPPANVPINTEGRREAVQPVDHDRIMRALIQGLK